MTPMKLSTNASIMVISVGSRAGAECSEFALSVEEMLMLDDTLEPVKIVSSSNDNVDEVDMSLLMTDSSILPSRGWWGSSCPMGRRDLMTSHAVSEPAQKRGGMYSHHPIWRLFDTTVLMLSKSGSRGDNGKM